VAVVVAISLGVGALVARWPPGGDRPDLSPAVTEAGSGRNLEKAYDRWKNGTLRGSTAITVALGYTAGLSARFTAAQGHLTIDPSRGDFTATVSGLASGELLDVWLVDSAAGPGRSLRPGPGDTMLRLGTLRPIASAATLRARLDGDTLARLEIDLVVVTPPGRSPIEGGVLFGMPGLFQRLYLVGQRGAAGRLARALRPVGPDQARELLRALVPASLLLPGPAFAGEPLALAARLDLLVAQGEHLFFNEQFQGNGRTCGTCHPATNNFTIDPAFIATLPPDDPLFVAERLPALRQNFENPGLMRQFGLILVNADGFEPGRGFVMRSVPHLLALSTSIAPVPGGQDGTTLPPAERTGWAGDGAPGGGTLREFAIGAVRQHFPQTLARVDGSDFRLPTAAELDALEAFQRSLGRQEDPDLATLRLRDTPGRPPEAQPEFGRRLFLVEGKCNQCHRNAGASSSLGPPGNFNVDSGVEGFILNPAGSPDGGFGGAPHPRGGFGNGTFSVPPLVEAADTPPFFHTGAVQTIEDAVDFYDGQSFNESPGAALVQGILFGSLAFRRSIGAFLRVLNALENIRSATALEESALRATWFRRPAVTLQRAHAELGDAIRVLEGAPAPTLYPDAVRLLGQARDTVAGATAATGVRARRALIQAAMNDQAAARRLLVIE
jgi:cytochrome c peroxidase